MASIYLIRHGRASWGEDDYDVLSPDGVRQSKILGAEFGRRGVRPDQVWSGTLNRQRATAEVCLPAAGIAVPCRQDPRWNEYGDASLVPGIAGRPPAEAQRLLERTLTGWLAGEPLGESVGWLEFRDRSMAVLQELLTALGRGGTGLVFTSGGVVSAICTVLLHLPPEGFLAVNRVIVNASITKVVNGRSGTSLVSLNEHGHFDGEYRELLSYR